MSVNSFMTYVKKRKDIAILLVVLALGLILLILGSSSGKVDDVSEETLENQYKRDRNLFLAKAQNFWQDCSAEDKDAPREALFA